MKKEEKARGKGMAAILFFVQRHNVRAQVLNKPPSSLLFLCPPGLVLFAAQWQKKKNGRRGNPPPSSKSIQIIAGMEETKPLTRRPRMVITD